MPTSRTTDTRTPFYREADPLVRALFESRGERSDLPGNAPILLDSYAAWLVEKGQVELFSVEVEEGQPVGARSHLLTLPQGRIFLGMGESINEGLLAVGGTNTRIIRLPREVIRDAIKEDSTRPVVIEQLKLWVLQLNLSIAEPLSRDPDHRVKPGNPLQAQAGQTMVTANDLLWLRIHTGSVAFDANLDVAWADPSLWLPLTPRRVLVPIENCIFEAVTTEDLASREGQVLWDSLQAFYHQLFEIRARLREGDTARELERLKQQEEYARVAAETAYDHLVAALGKKDKAILARYKAMSASPVFHAAGLVAHHQGIEISLPKGLDEVGTTGSPVDMILRASRLKARKVALRGEWWKASHGPLLARMETDNRPVALIPHGPDRYLLHDPVDDSTVAVTDKVAYAVTPFATSFYKPLPEKPLKYRDLLTFVYKDCMWESRWIFLLSFAGGVLGLVAPWATGIIFDTIIPAVEYSQLLYLTLGMLFAVGGAGAFNFLRNILVLRTEGIFDVKLQPALFDRLLRLPVDFYRNYTAGDLAERARTINMIREVFSGSMVNSIMSGLLGFLAIGLMLSYNVKLTLVGIGLGLFAACFTFITSYLKLHYERRILALEGKTQGLVLQLLTGISKLRNAGAEVHAFSSWTKTFSRQKQLDYKARGYDNVVSIFAETYILACSIIIFFMLFEFAQNDPSQILSTGKFLAFSAAFGLFIGGVLGIAQSFVQVINIGPMLARIQPILESVPESNADAMDPPELTGRIELSRIRFRYNPQDPLVIKDVSLTILPGEFVAFVGPSGSGKSTIMRLLLGFNRPEKGSIHYDNYDLASLDVSGVRRQMGPVLQNGQLLPGDIYSNIIGARSLSEQDAWQAAKLAGADTEIAAMPMGMHTLVNPSATTLSGGQIQRLLIARAIASNPKIFLLDEATSALDNRSQAVVTESLDRMKVTRVVIAHRLSTIMNADKIFVIVKGELVEQGDYHSLMRQNGVFAELARRQMVDEE